MKSKRNNDRWRATYKAEQAKAAAALEARIAPK